ncbi:MAG: hypothetical protein JW841_04185 [Deltaproteobacteria bacterium]|nr:hypothetical protein [Deltaproteobacteria bacterium]
MIVFGQRVMISNLLVLCVIISVTLIACSTPNRNYNPARGWVRFSIPPKNAVAVLNPQRSLALKVWSASGDQEVSLLCKALHEKLQAAQLFSTVTKGCDGTAKADYLLDVQLTEIIRLDKKDMFWRLPSTPDPLLETLVILKDKANGKLLFEATIVTLAMYSGHAGECTGCELPSGSDLLHCLLRKHLK